MFTCGQRIKGRRRTVKGVCNFNMRKTALCRRHLHRIPGSSIRIILILSFGVELLLGQNGVNVRETKGLCVAGGKVTNLQLYAPNECGIVVSLPSQKHD